MHGKPPRPPKDWTPNARTGGSSGSGPASGTGPVATDSAPAAAA